MWFVSRIDKYKICELFKNKQTGAKCAKHISGDGGNNDPLSSLS